MHPIAFQLGPLTVHWFGVMIALAFLAGMWTAVRRAPLAGISGEHVSDLVVPWLLLGSVLGARVLYVATYWKESFAGQPWWEIFMIQRGGLVFYGGLIGASLTTWQPLQRTFTLHLQHMFSFEYFAYTPIAEWGGRKLRIPIEDNAMLMEHGVQFLHPANYRLLVIR